MPWWEREFVSRAGTTAVGGSDNHWRSTTAAQGVGQPTTWVFATDRSPAAILDAVRAGRTTISAQPPHHGGALLTMDADEDFAGGRSAMLGGSVRSEGAVHVTIKVERGSGSLLRLISSGMVVASELVASPSSEHHFDVVLRSCRSRGLDRRPGPGSGITGPGARRVPRVHGHRGVGFVEPDGGLLLGIFEVNPLHNIVHVLVGAADSALDILALNAPDHLLHLASGVLLVGEHHARINARR